MPPKKKQSGSTPVKGTMEDGETATGETSHSPGQLEGSQGLSSARTGETSTSGRVTERHSQGVNPAMVRVFIKLSEDGTNWKAWLTALKAAADGKRARFALDQPQPDTPEDSAIRMMLFESIPDIWMGEVANKDSAYEAVHWLLAKFVGGKNEQSTNRWLRELNGGIRPGESLTHFYHRLLNLRGCLRDNGHIILDGTVSAAIINGLPHGATEPGMFPAAAVTPLEDLLSLILAVAERQGYKDPELGQPLQGSQFVGATAALPPPQGPPQGSSTPAPRHPRPHGDQQPSTRANRDQAGGRGKAHLTCRWCSKKGHFLRDCEERKNWEEARGQQQAMLAAGPWWPNFNYGPPSYHNGPPPGSSTSSVRFFPGAPVAYPGGPVTYPGWQLPSPPPPPSGEHVVISLNVWSPTMHTPEGVSWLVDSGASIHLVNDLSLLHHPVLHQKPIPLHLATSDAKGAIVATGSVCIVSAQKQKLWLHNVQCVPSAISNLISVSSAIGDGAQFETDARGAFVGMRGPEGWTSSIVMLRGLFYLHGVQPVKGVDTLMVNSVEGKGKLHSCELRTLWHGRLGHPGDPSMARLDKEGLVTCINVSLSPCPECPKQCESCIQGKNARPSFGSSTRPAQHALDRVHIDTVGPITPTSLTGERYWVTVVDEFTHHVASLAVKSKDVISGAVRDLLVCWQTQRETIVKCVRTDRGSEFINQGFKDFCAQQGTKLETSAPFTFYRNSGRLYCRIG